MPFTTIMNLLTIFHRFFGLSLFGDDDDDELLVRIQTDHIENVSDFRHWWVGGYGCFKH